jgi:anti-anti-sigma regulatory factor
LFRKKILIMPENSRQAPVFLVDGYSQPVLVRIDGRATFQNCAPLKDFFIQMISIGKRSFVIDFQKCSGMDSTFLGVLVGVALRLRKANPVGSLTLIRLGSRNLELVRNLGLHRLVTVDAGGATTPVGAGIAKALESGMPKSEVENARFVLEAHENLLLADDANAGKFQDVIAFLKNRVDQG